MQTKIHNILALDVGGRRIGVAVTNSLVRLPRPLITLEHDDSLWKRISATIDEESIDMIVVGLPRSLHGNETVQTIDTRNFVEELKQKIPVPVYFQDEALTSKKAEEELKNAGKVYKKTDIDALAATYILEDFLNDPHNKALNDG
jgi:putative holliday junction resolvase